MNQRPLGPEGVGVYLSNDFWWFSALSVQVEIVSDSLNSTDSEYSGREYGQVCGQISIPIILTFFLTFSKPK